MQAKRIRRIEYSVLTIKGARYAVLPEAKFAALCKQAKVEAAGADDGAASDVGLDRDDLAERLRQRRRSAGLTQAELARRAGVRTETLNRIERRRTTPDFATVRKLVQAMQEAESEL